MLISFNTYTRDTRSYTHLLGKEGMYILFINNAVWGFLREQGDVLNYTQLMVLLLAVDRCEAGSFTIKRSQYRVAHRKILLGRIPLQYATYSFGEFVRLGLISEVKGGWKLEDKGLRLVLLWERYVEDYFSVDGKWVVYGNILPSAKK